MASDVSLAMPHPCLNFRQRFLCVNLSELNKFLKKERTGLKMELGKRERRYSKRE